MVTRASLCLLLTAAAWGVSIEFTPFWPDRFRDSPAMERLWGPNTQWPIRTFPIQDAKKGLGGTYGLVFWPGETVTVRLTGSDAASVNQLSCADSAGEGRLPTERSGDGSWRIAIPPMDGKEPLLRVYRVRATAAGREVAARGLVVARAWSGVQGLATPEVPQHNIGMSEWGNGANPWTLMCFALGTDPTNPTYMPMRERPWWGVDVYGMRETYWFPRRNGTMAKTGAQLGSDAYLDPTLEWSAWWTYYAKGCSKWRGGWQWGPWAAMAPERIYPKDGKSEYYGMCYSDVKQCGGAMPNGLLFWQWGYQGLLRMARHSLSLYLPYPGKKIYWEPYDGWQDGLGGVGRSEEVGSMALYYRRCVAEGLDTAWAKGQAPFADFARGEFERFKAGDTRNDYMVRFRTLDLNARNFAMMHLAERQAVREFAHLDALPGFRNPNLGQPWLDRYPFLPMERDRRWLSQSWIELFGGGVVGSGGDYTHNSGPIADGSPWFSGSRGYRALGYTGATQAALWPICLLSGGFRHYGVMPGTKSDHDWSDAKYRAVIDDGSSFRRLDLFERVPMFYRPGGRLSGFDIAHCFGGFYGRYAAENEYASDQRWNSLAILAQQVAELPDRLRPLGGVLVVDSNNEEDRKAGKEFLSDREPWIDYLAAVHDLLGIVTYANSDTAAEIPDDIPRLYLPRMNGQGHAVLAAEVGGRRIQVPYPGVAAQQPGSPALRELSAAVRAACPGGWPLETQGGFVVAGWESSRGVWLEVENPMDPGRIHVARTGSVSVRLRGFSGRTPPPVYDLCGGDEPDPQRIDPARLSLRGDLLTIALDWPKGDARLFMIDHTPPPDAGSRRPTGARNPARRPAAAAAAAPVAAPAPTPAKPELADAAAPGRYQAMLLAELRTALAAGATPGFRLASLGAEAVVSACDADEVLHLRASGMGELTLAWAKLGNAERLSLALDLARGGRAAAHAAAAFYLIAAGRSDNLELHLSRSGGLAAAVTASFR